MPWDCQRCDLQARPDCEFHSARADENSHTHVCPGAQHFWFCNRIDPPCDGHHRPGPDLRPPIDPRPQGFDPDAVCQGPDDAIWLCGARGCEGHSRRGDDCLENEDRRSSEAKRRDADGPVWFCRWTGCQGHGRRGAGGSHPKNHYHLPTDAHRVETTTPAPSVHRLAPNLLTTIAAAGLRVRFSLYNFCRRGVPRGQHEAHAPRRTLLSEPSPDLWEWASALGVRGAERGGHDSSTIVPVETPSDYHAMIGSRHETLIPDDLRSTHLTSPFSRAVYSHHFVHIFPIMRSGSGIQRNRIRVVEYVDATHWTERHADRSGSHGAGGNLYVLDASCDYFVIALPFSLTAMAIDRLAGLLSEGLTSPWSAGSGPFAPLYFRPLRAVVPESFRLGTAQSPGVPHLVYHRRDDSWDVPVFDPFHVAVMMGKLLQDRQKWACAADPASTELRSEHELKVRYRAMLLNLLKQLVEADEEDGDIRQNLDVARINLDHARFSECFGTAANHLAGHLEYLLDSRMLFELEDSCRISGEMSANGHHWSNLFVRLMPVLVTDSRLLLILGARWGMYLDARLISPWADWTDQMMHPGGSGSPAGLPRVNLDEAAEFWKSREQAGQAHEALRSAFEGYVYIRVWKAPEVLAARRTTDNGQSSHEINEAFEQAAAKYKDNLRGRLRQVRNLSETLNSLDKLIGYFRLVTQFYDGEVDVTTAQTLIKSIADALGEPVSGTRLFRLQLLFRVTAAMLDGSYNSYEAARFYQRGDLNACVTAGILASISYFTAVYSLEAGVAALTGPVGWVLGAIVLIGGIILLKVTDSDYEVFARMCIYRRHGIRRTEPGSGDEWFDEQHRSWSQQSADGFQNQLVGLLCIIYKIKEMEFIFSMPMSVLILKLGANPAGATADIHVDFDTDRGPATVTMRIDSLPLAGRGACRPEFRFHPDSSSFPHMHGRDDTQGGETSVCWVSAADSEWTIRIGIPAPIVGGARLREARVRLYPFGRDDEFHVPAGQLWRRVTGGVISRGSGVTIHEYYSLTDAS